ncbi:MAG: hypothetical protein AAF714_06055 [Pseudomonadota bacterium]
MIYLPAPTARKSTLSFAKGRDHLTRLTGWLHAAALNAEARREIAKLTPRMRRDAGLPEAPAELPR